MRDYLSDFVEDIRLAATNEVHERMVRLMLGRVAVNAPLPALLHLGQALIEYHKAELKAEAERN